MNFSQTLKVLNQLFLVFTNLLQWLDLDSEPELKPSVGLCGPDLMDD